jgi:hypothetical protein
VGAELNELGALLDVESGNWVAIDDGDRLASARPAIVIAVAIAMPAVNNRRRNASSGTGGIFIVAEIRVIVC